MADDPRSTRSPGAPPAPVRPASVPHEARAEVAHAETGTGEDGGHSSTTPLTPARAMGRAEAPASPTTPDLEQAEVEVDGHSWSVRVMGRAAGAGVARVPMLLLGFWSDADCATEPERECLVVGRTLDALSEAELERVFTESRPPIPRPDLELRESGRRGRRGGATPRHAT